jgi:hypothetical protein
VDEISDFGKFMRWLAHTYYPAYGYAALFWAQWDAWVNRMIESEDNAELEFEDWAYDEDGPKWREG